MNRFVDIHHHLIYGVDDGARTLEDMQQMILRAVEENVGDIVCTSHITPGENPFPEERYMRHLQEAQSWCEEKSLPVKIHPGCEILYTDVSARLVQEGKIPTLAGSRFVLVEFLPGDDYKRFCDAARTFGMAGYSVIFAHVERYQALRNHNRMRQLREEYGVYMQMNTNTVISKKGFFEDRWIRKTLDAGLIDCVATDAHNASSRPCSMRACYDVLKTRYGEAAAEDMCGGFQREILEL